MIYQVHFRNNIRTKNLQLFALRLAGVVVDAPISYKEVYVCTCRATCCLIIIASADKQKIV